MAHVVVQKVSFLLISQSTAVGSTQSTLPGVFRVGRKWGATIFGKMWKKGLLLFDITVSYFFGWFQRSPGERGFKIMVV